MVGGIRKVLVRSRRKSGKLLDEAAEFYNKPASDVTDAQFDEFLTQQAAADGAASLIPTKPLLGAGALGIGGYWVGSNTDGSGGSGDDDGGVSLWDLITGLDPLQLAASAAIIAYVALQYGPDAISDLNQWSLFSGRLL